MFHAKIKHLLKTPGTTQTSTSKGIQVLLCTSAQLCLQTNCFVPTKTHAWTA